MPPATTSQQANQNLQQFASGIKSPDVALKEAEDATGAPQAQQQVSGLRTAIQNSTSLLDRVAPSVMGRTQNSLVTSAQADRQVANEQAPINAQLNKEQTDYTNANADYSNAEQQAQARANGVVAGQQNQLSYLQNVYSNLKQSEDTAAASAEARREFDASQALSREQAAAAAAAARSSAPKLVGGTGTPRAGTIARDNSGGYRITNASGQPITLGQYAAANGMGINDISQLLMQSGNPNDQKIAAAINSNRYTSQQLRQMFPQALGGSY